MSFYNTTHQAGGNLTQLRTDADKQEDIIYNVFKEHSDKDFTPFEIQQHLARTGKHYPTTSVRRAITDLTAKDKLEKTSEQRIGEYGKNTYAWKLKAESKPIEATQVKQQNLFAA